MDPHRHDLHFVRLPDVTYFPETTVRVLQGSSALLEPPTAGVEQFLSMLQFDSKEKLSDLGIEIDHNINLTMSTS